MGTSKPYSAMSREELLDEIHTAQKIIGQDRALPDIVQELRVHQEEVEVQQCQLLEAQRALEDSRDRYADLYDFAPVAFVSLDRSGVIQEANLAAAALLGVERARLVGFPLLVYVDQRDRRAFLDHLSRCREGSEVVRTRLHVSSRAGEVLLVDLVGRVATRSADRPLWYTGMIDVTESERTDEQRRAVESERLRMQHEEQAMRTASATKDRFLASLSHELRTPLTPILLKLGSLEARDAIPSELREPLAVIRRNIEHEARLIDDLLDTSRIVHGKLQIDDACIDVHGLIDQLVETAWGELHAAGLQLGVTLEATEHHVRGDSVRLRQVLWNLVSNAQRFTPRGGHVTITTANERPEMLTIRVSDTGAGIAPELVDRIFDPFEQIDRAPRDGLGLGLAISKGIVDAHRGSIRAHSGGPQRGTTIEIDLGTTMPCAEPAVAAETPKPGGETGLRILLVEDHPDSADSLVELLQLYGHQVELARSFAEAVSRGGEPFNLLITDIGLPDGDGLELLQAIGARNTENRMSSIALSGYAAEHDIERSRQAGFDCHLRKPVEIDHLLQAIDEVMRARGTDCAHDSPA